MQEYFPPPSLHKEQFAHLQMRLEPSHTAASWSLYLTGPLKRVLNTLRRPPHVSLLPQILPNGGLYACCRKPMLLLWFQIKHVISRRKKYRVSEDISNPFAGSCSAKSVTLRSQPDRSWQMISPLTHHFWRGVSHPNNTLLHLTLLVSSREGNIWKRNLQRHCLMCQAPSPLHHYHKSLPLDTDNLLAGKSQRQRQAFICSFRTIISTKPQLEGKKINFTFAKQGHLDKAELPMGASSKKGGQQGKSTCCKF